MTEPYVSFEDVQPSQRQDGSRQVLLLILSLVGVFLLYQGGGGILTYLIVGDLSVAPDNVGLFRAVTMVSQLLFILLPTLLVARISGIAMSAVFPMRIPSLVEVALAFLGLLSLQRVLETILYLQSLIPLPDIVESLLTPMKEMLRTMMMTLVTSETPWEFVAVLMVVAIVPSIVEEVFFRGLIQSLLDHVAKPVWGFIGSGVLFGLFHLNPFDIIGLAGLGVFFAYTRYRSASIWIPVVLHFVNNGLAVVVVSTGMDNDEMLIETMGSSPSIGLVLAQAALFLALFIVIVRLYGRITQRLHGEEAAHAM